MQNEYMIVASYNNYTEKKEVGKILRRSSPEENRTPIAAVKGRCTNRYTTGPCILRHEGLEPSTLCLKGRCSTD